VHMQKGTETSTCAVKANKTLHVSHLLRHSAAERGSSKAAQYHEFTVMSSLTCAYNSR